MVRTATPVASAIGTLSREMIATLEWTVRTLSSTTLLSAPGFDSLTVSTRDLALLDHVFWVTTSGTLAIWTLSGQMIAIAYRTESSTPLLSTPRFHSLTIPTRFGALVELVFTAAAPLAISRDLWTLSD